MAWLASGMLAKRQGGAHLSKMGLSCMMSDIMPPVAPRAKKINMPRASCSKQHRKHQQQSAMHFEYTCVVYIGSTVSNRHKDTDGL
jgi:hypothetical protein